MKVKPLLHYAFRGKSASLCGAWKQQLQELQEFRSSGVRSQEPGARSQEPGARSQEPGARSQEPGARSTRWRNAREELSSNCRWLGPAFARSSRAQGMEIS